MAKDETRSNVGNVVDGLDTGVNKDGNSGAEDDSFDLFMLNLKKQEKEQIFSDSRIKQARDILLAGEFAARKTALENFSGTEKEKAAELKKFNDALRTRTAELARKLEENNYAFSTKESKRQAKDSQKRTLENGKEVMKQKVAEFTADNNHLLANISKHKHLARDTIQATREQIKCEQQKRALTNGILKEKRKDGVLTVDELKEQFGLIAQTYEEERKGHEENIGFINEQIAALEKAKEDEKAKGLPTYEIDKVIKELKGEKEQEKEAAKESDKKRFKEELKDNAILGAVKGLENSVKLFADKAGEAMNTAMEMVGQYQGVIDARLQGTQSSYDKFADVLKSNLAASPLIRQTEVLKKLNDAVDKGIAYNVEQRAFLATMTDKIVSTFDAFDSNLMRLIRLQQADTTAARQGMEATLLQFFNSTYSDSSYLSEGYDDVSKALIDANAGMSRDMSIAFEFNVQKWMGSLASLGFGTETLTTIAQGINNLGSGNVAALAGNTQLQNLLAMSASRAGLSYSDLLVKGIDDSSVNELLESMVRYLKEIAEDKNAVVKAAYGDVFNFTQSDLRAVRSLTEGDISNISNQTMTFSKAMNETQRQLDLIGDRVSMAQKIDTVFDNIMYTSAESLASDPVSAFMWKSLDLIESITGGIEIPFINVYGFGLDLNMSMESLLQTGMFGLSFLGNLGKMASSLGGAGMELDNWGFDEYTRRGGNFQSSVGGVQSSKSGSVALTSSSSSSDSKKSAIASTEEDQEEQKKSSKEMAKDEITVETLYNEIFENKTVVYTVDVPAVTRMDIIKQHTELISTKMDTVTIATALASTKANEIYNLLTQIQTNGLSVRVSNAGDLVAGFPTMPDTVSISETSRKDLASKIGQAILGMSNGLDGGDKETHTISDLVNLLAYGTLSVQDTQLTAEIKDLNKNLI